MDKINTKINNQNKNKNFKELNNNSISKINQLILVLLIYIIKYKLDDNSLNLFKELHLSNNISNSKKSYKQPNFLKKMSFTADGVKYSFKNDISIIFAYSFSIPLSILHFVFAPNLITKIFGLFIFSLLIIFETLNTSIEATVDRIGLEYNILSKVAKDTATIPSAIVTIIILISSGLLGYNIYLNYIKWEIDYIKMNPKLTNKQKKIYFSWEIYYQ